MDLVASCKDKLTYFRIKELKDVLTQLGLSKQGKKQDLVDRILAILSDERGMWAKKNAIGKEGVAKLVDDTYRKMQVSGSAELASKSEAVSDSANVKLKEETEDSYHKEKIRCLCGSTLPTDSMIKCEDPRCNVWQHMTCVLIPDKPIEGNLPNPPDVFFCELCRLNRADPFWVPVSHPLLPVKLNITDVPSDGSSPTQSIERTFQLLRSDRDLLSKQEYDIQAWCMLLNDKVVFRMQWPQYADFQINGVPVRAINRPGSQLLGANGRDDGLIITSWARDGINKIIVGGCDARLFCVGVRIVKKRTLQQVLNLIPEESEGECFEDALARVCRCVGGGTATENADDSDSDVEVVADSIPVNLRCPMSGLRMKVAGRFKPCVHMGCFDLGVFVEMNQRSRKWQCPICLKNFSLEKIIIDPYFNRITSKMQNCDEDVAEIEVKPDGSWRVKADGVDRRSLGELGLWHLPDGSISASMNTEPKQRPEFKPIKTEAGSDDMQGITLPVRFEENINGQNIIPMSSSATVSGRDCEDVSVNQGGTLDFSAMNGLEYDSISMNIDPVTDAEVIVLSDSEEEIEPLMASLDHNNNSEIQFPLPQQTIPDPYYENGVIGNSGSPGLGLFTPNDDEFGINMWSLPSTSQGNPGFQLFGSDLDVSDALVELQHNHPLNCPPSINGYTLGGETATLAPNSSNGLVDNPLAFNNGNDPSLQLFLPTRPSEAVAEQSDFRDLPEVSNGVHTPDWISLRLGDGDGVGSGSTNGLNSGKLQPKDARLDPFADNVKDNGCGKERSDNPFSFPRQKRSVRPRLYLSIDSGSE